jgi:probable phosphoglycerate mutase
MPTIFLIRHGENPANITKEFSYKHVDYSLTEKGRLQAQQTAAWCADQAMTQIYSSPLKRACETAEIIRRTLYLPAVHIREAFREINVGHLEGQRATTELWTQYTGITTAWEQGDASRTFPGGENYHDVLTRMRHGLQEIKATQPHDARVVIVGHGGIFNATICDLCHNMKPDDLACIENHNCSVTEIDRSGVEMSVKFWANSDHLSGKAAELISGVLKT